MHIYEEAKKDEFMGLKFFADFNTAKENLLIKLISFEKNKDRLQTMPHIRYLDFAITFIFYLNVNDEMGEHASIQIENSHLALWRSEERREGKECVST